MPKSKKKTTKQRERSSPLTPPSKERVRENVVLSKQKQRQKQVQNVIVNVNNPKAQRRSQ